MKPPDQLDNMNMIHLISGVITKLQFLGKINESEDNSSDLCGFEINKLLHEQNRRESEYANLIKQRSLLKGIENKKKYDEVQVEISDVARALKESTKKLCRLFKENTNPEDDTQKARREREELLEHLEKFTSNIQGNTFEALLDVISDELDSQNKLPKYIEKEKQLTNEIKVLKNNYHMENTLYQNEMSEKQQTINSLKDELSKARAESKIKMSYDKKQTKTKQNTQYRLAKQNQEDINNQIKEQDRLKARETQVHEKISSFLTSEEERIKKCAEEWQEKCDKNRDIMEKEIETIQQDTKKCKERFEKIQEEYLNEKYLQDNEDARIKKILDDKKAEKEKQKQIDSAMMLIQQRFEVWLSIVGPTKKKGGMKKK